MVKILMRNRVVFYVTFWKIEHIINKHRKKKRFSHINTEGTICSTVYAQ